MARPSAPDPSHGRSRGLRLDPKAQGRGAASAPDRGPAASRTRSPAPGLLGLGLALAVLATPPAAAAQGGPGGAPRGPWTALPMPSLARAPAPTARLAPLERGTAFLRRGEPTESWRPAAFPPGAILGLLQDEIAARGLAVELNTNAVPLLARGSEADLETLRGVLAQLDGLGRALEVSLSVWIEAPAVGDEASPAGFESVAAREPDFRAAVRSGQAISFGERGVAAFLTGYDSEVAQSSGVAEPELTRALLGDVLHVRASRVRGGSAVHLACLAESTALADEDEGGVPRFDPGGVDLGIMEQPRVRLAQVAFADVVPAGGATRLSIRGSEDGWADRTVWIRAETAADPDPGGDGWSGLDLALFERRSIDLPLPEPGAELESELVAAAAEGGPLDSPGGDARVLREAFTAAQVAAGSESGGARRRPGLVWTPGYLLAPAASESLEQARSLVTALEGERLRPLRLAVAHGTLRVDLPAVAGSPLRVLFGTETLRVVDYSTHVAQESWMPVPEVARVFDGLCVHAALEGEALRGLAWVARTEGQRELERDDVGVGRLQLLEREFQSRPLLLEAPGAGAGSSALALRSTSPGLTLELRRPE